MRNKNVFWGGLVIVLMVAAVLSYLKYDSRPKIQTQEFSGVIQEIGEDTLTVSGFYMVDNETFQTVSSEAVEVVVEIGADTKFEKTVTYLPVGEAGQSFSYQDLRKETLSGSLDDIRELELAGSNVKIKAMTNIYGKLKFQATEIDYAADVTDIK